MLQIAGAAGYYKKLVGIRNLARAARLLRNALRMEKILEAQTSQLAIRPVCFVLGNGPSLAEDLKGRLDVLSTGDVVCVNSFVTTDWYETIQPKYYVIADPSYWLASHHERYIAHREKFFEQILSKTSWPLTMYVPFAAKDLFEATLSHEQNIRLIYFNNDLELGGTKDTLHMLYDLGLGMPLVHNVLISAIFLPLRLGYKKIILLGADHSWHQTLALDDANRVCIRVPHFYNADAQLKPLGMGEMAVHGEKFFTMATLFSAFAGMFDGYWKLEAYSKHLGAQIYNASSVTFIDAFKRKPISDLLAELTDGAKSGLDGKL